MKLIKQRTGIFMSSLLVFSANSFAIEDRGLPLSTAIWPDEDINVCWEDVTDSTAAQRLWIRNAAEGSWEVSSSVDFIGWGQCAAGDDGIRIGVADTGPHTKGLGTQIDGTRDGMVLNFTYANWGQDCQSSVRTCSEYIAVHEFGHALGFAHEQNRGDTPSTCTDHPQGTSGDTTIGEWDLDSVMNYCNPQWNGDGTLSNTDIAMVRLFYPPTLENSIYDTGISWAEGSPPTVLLRGDFNGDGIEDILQARGESDSSPVRYIYFTYLSNSDGSYTKSSYDTGFGWAEGSPPTKLIAGDFNGDGKTDILQARGEADTSPTRYIYFTHFSNGDGSYTKSSYDTGFGWTEGSPPTKLIAGDFNGDGKTDILQARGEADTSPTRYIYFTHFSNGDGSYTRKSFDTAFGWTEGSPPTELIAGDFNGDGKTDILQARGEADTSPVRYIYFTHFSNGDGGFTRKSFDTGFGWTEGSPPTKLMAGDFNGDGKTDILQARGEADTSPVRYIYFTHFSNGDGGFTRVSYDTEIKWAEGGLETQLFTGDFNGDGTTDIMQAKGKNEAYQYVLYQYLSDGLGGYVRSSFDTDIGGAEGGIPTSFISGDFNGVNKDTALQARGETDTAPARYLFITYDIPD